jgi:hypothetical protein
MIDKLQEMLRPLAAPEIASQVRNEFGSAFPALKSSLDLLESASRSQTPLFNGGVAVAGAGLLDSSPDIDLIGRVAALDHAVEHAIAVSNDPTGKWLMLTIAVVMTIASAKEAIAIDGESTGLEWMIEQMMNLDKVCANTPGWGLPVAIGPAANDDDDDDDVDTTNAVPRLFLDFAAVLLARRMIVRQRGAGAGPLDDRIDGGVWSAPRRLDSALRRVVASSRPGTCFRRAQGVLRAIVHVYDAS